MNPLDDPAGKSIDESADLPDEAVVAAAEALGGELAIVRGESTPFEFTSLLIQCNEAISDETGIDYGESRRKPRALARG